jgi:predicted dienelactone hydrolase
MPGALGLSMGGNTVLALAGGRIDPVRLANYCDGDLNPSFCGWLKQSGVDLHTMDMKFAGRDNQDRRIKFAMAIDPAPVDVFQTESFSQASIPVQIVNLGRPGTIPLTALASGIAKAIPMGTYSTLGNASHFSMFGECKPAATELAKSEDIDEPICSDGEGHSRVKVHMELINMVVGAFNQMLKYKR